MKQKLRLFTSLLLLAVASAAWGGVVTVTKTTNQLVSENSWSVSSGTNINGLYTNFNLDANISISTTGNPNCGSIWGSDTYDWRLYQAQNGNVTVTAANGATLKSVKFVYSTSNGGVLKDSNLGNVNSGTVKTVTGTTITFTVGNTGNKTNGQVRITEFEVVYEQEGAVEKADPEIAFSQTSVTINEGETLPEITFSNPHSVSVNFTSSNPNVATVNERGVISLVEGGIGTSVITATSVENDEYVSAKTTCTIRVNDPRQTPTLEWQDANGEKVTSMTIYQGDAFTAPTVSYDGDGAKTFASSEVSVATIDDSGTVTIKGVGSTEISVSTAKTDNYKAATAKYTLSVVEKVIGDVYELVTDASTLAADDKIIITNAEGTFALSTTQNSNNRGQKAVVAEDNKIVLGQETEVQVLTLEGNADGWNFYTGSGYLYAASSSSNHLKTETDADDNAKASIEIANGEATITFQGTNTRNMLRYNSSSKVFSCYASGQGAVSIYKLAVVDERQEAGLAFSQESVTVNLGETATVTLSKETNADVEITYSVEGVATYDVATGVITPLKAGTTEVTATAAENDNYKAGSAVLTIKVIDPNASEAMFDFDNDYKTLFPSLKGVSSGSGDEYVSDGDINEDLKATVDGVALTVSAGVPVEGASYFNPNRIWVSSPRLRMYSGTLTISAPAGYEITGLEISQGKWNDGNSANVGTLSSTGWTGNAQTVVISIAGNTQFKSINVMTTKIDVVTFDENAQNASDFAAVYDANVDEIKNVQMLREFGYDYWNTFVVPFNLTRTQLEEAFGEGVQVAKYTGFDKPANIKFETVDGDVTRADLMIVKPAATVTNPIFKGVTLEKGKAYNYPSYGKNYSDTNFTINGRFAKQVLTDSDYFGKVYFLNKQGQFTHPKADGNVIRGFRWFIQLKTPESSTGAKITLDVDGDVTSIDAIDNGQFATDAIYNLSGQRVNKAQKGIYIVNGKKVVVK